jgi:hypothetical protein
MSFALTHLALACLAFASASCSTVFNRTQKTIRVNSTPSGLKFDVKNRDGALVYNGVTPAEVKLSSRHGFMKGQTYLFTAYKNGKVHGTSILDARISGWYWGNFAGGGLAGMLLLDPLTGSMWTMAKDVHIGKGVSNPSNFVPADTRYLDATPPSY